MLSRGKFGSSEKRLHAPSITHLPTTGPESRLRLDWYRAGRDLKK
jgi:hypothetical protein